MTVSFATGLALRTTVVVPVRTFAVQVPPLAAQLVMPKVFGTTLSTLPLPVTVTVRGRFATGGVPAVKATVQSAVVAPEAIATVPVFGSVPTEQPGPQATVVLASAGVAVKMTDVVAAGTLPVQVPPAAVQPAMPMPAGVVLSTLPVPVPVTFTVKGMIVTAPAKSAAQLSTVAVGETVTIAVSGVAPTLQSVPLQVTVPPLAVKVTALVLGGSTALQLVPPATLQSVIPTPAGAVLSTLPVPLTVTFNVGVWEGGVRGPTVAVSGKSKGVLLGSLLKIWNVPPTGGLLVVATLVSTFTSNVA